MSDTTTSGASTLEKVSVSDLAKHVQSLSDRVDDLEQEVAEKDERIDNLEQQVDSLEDKVDEAEAHRNAIVRQTQTRDERIDELQAREFEKGAHLLAENVDEDRITVDGN
jgi:peptidoglycan hydrolase CwlO-like protein